MAICKNLLYYVAPAGKRFYYGRATHDILQAQISLDKARRLYPGESWEIVTYAA